MSHLSTTPSIRAPAVAGLFYPGDPNELRALIARLFADAQNTQVRPGPQLRAPKALIVPHAGYVYSGLIAAAAFRCIESLRESIRRVVLIGPSHRAYVRGIAVPRVDRFASPLGEIAIDATLRNTLLQRGDVIAEDAPHEMEHCLEVQLPFLQTVLNDFTLLPLLVGVATPEYVASVLSDVWGGPETLLLASSDLSHYHSYEAAREIDSETAGAIMHKHSDITHEQACGATGINGLNMLARRRDLLVAEVARNNSGDTAGDRRRVVGYGAFALCENGDVPRPPAP